MPAFWYDGRVARAQPADVRAEAGALVIAADDGERRWPLAGIDAADHGDGRVRLTSPGEEGRLVLPAEAWRALAGGEAEAGRLRSRRRELKLVAGLAAAGIGGALVVFFGVPAASGPLAAVTPPAFEERIGRNLEAQLTALFPRCRGDRVGRIALGTLGEELEAQTDRDVNVRVRAVEAPMVNAFALPGGAVFVTDDLIESSRTPDELSAVIAHEIAHVEQRHVMRAVWRSLGAGLLLDLLVGGGSGAGQQAVLLAGSFTELSYSRELEAEADARGRELLHRAGFSSQGMEPFFRRLAGAAARETTAREVAEFLGSHPDTLRRAARARAAARPGKSALSEADWQAVRRLCSVSDKPIIRIDPERLVPRRGPRPPRPDEVDDVGED